MRLSERVEDAFEKAAAKTSAATGSFWAFALALAAVAIWALLGPPFHFSETWQLVINTATTIITFLMVFVIQHAQNKDTRAMQLKLNELISAIDKASNRLIDIEGLADREIDHLHKYYQELARTAARVSPKTHSTDTSEPPGPPEVERPEEANAR